MDAVEARSSRSGFMSCCLRSPQVVEDDAAVELEQQHSGKQQAATHGTAVTAHAGPTRRAPTPDMVPTEPRVSGASGAVRVADQAVPAATAAAAGEMPNIKPLTALSMNRTYTDDDWFAAMAALEKVKKLQQARALAQLRASGHRPSGGAAGAAGADDDTDIFFDARSNTLSDCSAGATDADHAELDKLVHEIEAREHAQQQLTVSVGRELAPPGPSCVPNPPLLFAEPHWRYRQVDLKPFCFYWERDPVRSSPYPLPIDEQMKLNQLFKKTHESIPGMWLREVGDQLLLHATPTVLAIPGIVNYTEYYNKDQSPCSWTLRRDIKIGKTVGQMFMTTDGILIFRVFTYGMFSKAIEWIGEDYTRLEDNGETIVTRQLCKLSSDSSVCSQFLIGRKIGPVPPKGRAVPHV